MEFKKSKSHLKYILKMENIRIFMAKNMMGSTMMKMKFMMSYLIEYKNLGK
jgi:hypothetical protein